MAAMDVVIAGGHGQVALRLARLLTADGHRCRALIRNPDHAADVADAGAEPVVIDLEAVAGVQNFGARETGRADGDECGGEGRDEHATERLRAD